MILAVTIDDTIYLTIGEVSKLIGRSTQTIKRWEDTNKIPASTRQQSNNWRIYSPNDVDAIKKYSNSFNKPSLQADLLKGSS
ncbi:MAG: MerR family DNA-binding transcriptional regulator [Gammaproteobacteria bacterium]|nr:MAG: MerR family DNA-binding transcriptional regulator [Gammaproteobacteria bacterium]RLA54287.1 MAG: MerR family DNA-binding transcriptional regulator [Gammaproteobacteria bacterium]